MCFIKFNNSSTSYDIYFRDAHNEFLCTYYAYSGIGALPEKHRMQASSHLSTMFFGVLQVITINDILFLVLMLVLNKGSLAHY